MDFFQHQDRARRKTTLLILYFVIAVVLIIAAVNLVFYLFVAYFANAQYSSIEMSREWSAGNALLTISLITLLVIISGSLFRFVSLMGGGHAVAEMAGARFVNPDTDDINEKKFINVVEEMAIASGTPVPVLYVMDNEPGINAFVAGYQPTECVMVVTAGALEQLNRDQLQAVVAHEYSHILNGDMRINVRLMAILAGILLIGKLGELLMRSSGNRRGKGSGGGVMLGLGLFVIGYIGLFFGRLIKAAISRQREFLADASSVQFTRNPRAMAGALFRIRESMAGTYLSNDHAEDMSHMCFAQTMKISFQRLLATHPPLDERINAVDPSFLKLMRANDIIEQQEKHKQHESVSSFAGVKQYAVTPEQLTTSIGNPGVAHVALGGALLDSMPNRLHKLLHTENGARAVVYALVIQPAQAESAFTLLSRHETEEFVELVSNLCDDFAQIDPRQRLPMIDLVIPSLKRLSQQAADKFIDHLQALIQQDERFTLFEFVLLAIIKKHLAKHAGHAARVRYHSFGALHEDMVRVFSMLVMSSGQNVQKNQVNLRNALQSYGIDPISEAMDTKASKLEASLVRLGHMSMLLKKNFIHTCAELVIEDGIVMPSEAELLRAIAEFLDCPMPPLLPAAARA